MTADRIARLKVTLRHVVPVVTRRIEVPLDIQLDCLHLTLQVAMGWTNSHLYEFRVRDVGWGLPDGDWDGGRLDSRKASLLDVLEDTGAKSLQYLYDFGDGWEHTIKIERIVDAVPGTDYPRLLEATGRCPPEDVGGPWGYGDFLEAIANPKHERYAEFMEWLDEPSFDPKTADTEVHAQALAALAKAWTRSPKTRRKNRA